MNTDKLTATREELCRLLGWSTTTWYRRMCLPGAPRPVPRNKLRPKRYIIGEVKRWARKVAEEATGLAFKPKARKQ